MNIHRLAPDRLLALVILAMLLFLSGCPCHVQLPVVLVRARDSRPRPRGHSRHPTRYSQFFLPTVLHAMLFLFTGFSSKGR